MGNRELTLEQASDFEDSEARSYYKNEIAGESETERNSLHLESLLQPSIPKPKCDYEVPANSEGLILNPKLTSTNLTGQDFREEEVCELRPC